MSKIARSAVALPSWVQATKSVSKAPTSSILPWQSAKLDSDMNKKEHVFIILCEKYLITALHNVFRNYCLAVLYSMYLLKKSLKIEKKTFLTVI